VLSHIISRRDELKLGRESEVSLPEAIRAWYAEAYEPVLRVIEKQNMLAAFPGRTPADLYVWIMDHWEILKKKHGASLSIIEAATRFGSSQGGSLAAWFRSVITGRPAKPPD